MVWYGKDDTCYACGRSECKPSCPRVRGNETGDYSGEPKTTHKELGWGHPSCECHICKSMRARGRAVMPYSGGPDDL